MKESTGTVSSVGTEFVTDERKGNQKKKKYKGSYFKNETSKINTSYLLKISIFLNGITRACCQRE